MKTINKWFSIIEIIITIWIMLIIWVIASTSYSYMLEKTYDGKITNDLINIKNSIETYYKEHQELPLPNWNQKYYNIAWWYEHEYEDEETYWVSWYITEDTIEKRYMNYLPLDPRTNQYYWYAKTKKIEWYQIAAVIKENWEYKSKVEWKWRWDMWLRNLIKEYNWPNFVSRDSKEYFPYNPKERLLTAKINSYSGIIKINDKTLTTPEEIKEYIIKKWDKLEIEQNAKVEIYYSDGSKSILWDTQEPTIITFTNMDYVEENNLYTTIKITLDMWSIWSKASKLADKSEFEVYTADAVAAVRWTVFWLKKQSNQTNIVLVRWKVEVNKIQDWEKQIINSPITQQEDEKSYIEVQKEEPPKWIIIKQLSPNLWTNTETQTSTWMLQELPQSEIEELIESKIPQELKEELEQIFELESKSNKLKCNKWYKVIMWKCQEVFNWCKEQEQSSTWAYICDRYKEILKRDPSKLEFDKLINQNLTKAQIEEEISIDWYLWFKNGLEKYFNKNYECKWQRTFRINYGCVNNYLIDYYDRDWKVVAYAPYNKDLKMWKWESLIDWEETENFIYAEYNSLSDWTYENYNQSTNVFDSQAWWVLQEESNRPNINWAIPRKVSLENNLDIIQWNEEKWIFIDNYNNSLWNQDYIKYSINDLNLTWSFAIEMSVRGAALKRGVNCWNFYCYLFTTNLIEFKLWSDGLKLWSSGKDIYIPNSKFTSLDDNTFYSIKVIVENNHPKIIVNWNIIAYETDNFYLTNISNIWTQLYIWSKIDKTQQWNDIIDYVKIYKR